MNKEYFERRIISIQNTISELEDRVAILKDDAENLNEMFK